MIIFIHEFGHYTAAIKVGVRVEKFYLGFDFWGLKLFKFDYKGTEYGIGVFPLGGYVKMAGQNDFGETDSIGKPDEFTSKTVWERIQVLAAGVVFNFISAFFFMGGALTLGHQMLSPVVGEIIVGSPAWESPLKKGDRIISYNNIPITSFDSLSTEVALSDSDIATKIEIEREGQKHTFEVTPRLNDMEIPYLGFMPIQTKQIKGVVVDSSAEKAGFKPGDIIQKVDGVPLKTWRDLTKLVQESGRAKKELNIDILRDKQNVSLTLLPEEKYNGMLGFLRKSGNEIKAVKPGSEAESLKLEKGMKIVSVHGQTIEDLSELDLKDDLKSFKLQYQGVDGLKTVTIPFTWLAFQKMVYMGRPGSEDVVEVARVIKGSIAEEIGMKQGDTVLSFRIDDSEVRENPNWNSLSYSIARNVGKTVYLKIKRADKSEVNISGKIGKSKDPYYLLGLESKMKSIEGEILKTTVLWPLHLLRWTYRSLLRMFTGKVSSKHISGPVGIAKATYQMANNGLSYLLYFMAILSISIAFFNCLPIPVLDGGQLLFCLIEWVKGSPVSDRFMIMFQYLGFGLIMCLLVFATWNDLTSKF